MFETLFAPYTDVLLLFARIIVGAIFLYYGIPKIKDLKGAAEEMKEKGLRPAAFWGTAIALLEVFGGTGLILGIYTWFWALLFSIMMIGGTIIKIKNPQKGFGSWSYDLLILAITLLLLSVGAGAYALF